VNSANLGPYGDAIVTELIPYLDAHFATIPRRFGRALTGESTGGWEALAQQVFYPRTYAGTWAGCPDPVDFRFHQLVDVYSDRNAYVHHHDGLDVPRPSARTVPGDTLWTMAEENHWELALGTRGRSGLGQWDIWQAVFGPQGPDGYPAPVWDKETGRIHHAVARSWRTKDLRATLAARWPALGPLLRGRIHVFVGDDDTFFLNNAVELLQRSLARRAAPPADAEVRYGRNQPHCWIPYTTAGLVTTIARALAHAAPAGGDTRWLGDAAMPAGPPAVAPARRAWDRTR
jgi:hypothetical protein